MADVKVKGLVKKYGGMSALHSIDLDIRNGEFIVFVGPCPGFVLVRLFCQAPFVGRPRVLSSPRPRVCVAGCGRPLMGSKRAIVTSRRVTRSRRHPRSAFSDLKTLSTAEIP
jgi:hypothetical protein